MIVELLKFIIMNEIFFRVQGIIAGYFGITRDQVQLNSDLEADFSLDSLEKLDLLLHIEREFNVDLSDIETENIETVKDIVNLLQNKL